MPTQWIEQCTVQRVSLQEGLVLDLDDYSELVISRPMRLTLPAVGAWPEEEVLIDPAHLSPEERTLLDLAGAVCTRAWFDDDGSLHLGFSGGHRIDVPQTRQRPRGNSMANGTATWHVCLVAESERFGTTFLPKTTTRIIRNSLHTGRREPSKALSRNGSRIRRIQRGSIAVRVASNDWILMPSPLCGRGSR